MLLFWGCDPETTAHPIQGMMSSRLCYWLSEIGLKSVYVCPDLNYGAAVHADKWIPILPNTDAALQLAIAYVWITEGTYDKEYIATHSYGFEKFEDYVLGKEDGVPKTPAWASEKCGVSDWTIKALARDWANKTTSLIHGNGGPGIRGPYSSEPARLEAMLLGMSGLGKPGVHQAKMIEWFIWREWLPASLSGHDQARPAHVLRAGASGRSHERRRWDDVAPTKAPIPSCWRSRHPRPIRRCRSSPSASSTTPSSIRPSAGGDCTASSNRPRSSSTSTPTRHRAAPRST